MNLNGERSLLFALNGTFEERSTRRAKTCKPLKVAPAAASTTIVLCCTTIRPARQRNASNKNGQALDDYELNDHVDAGRSHRDVN